MSDYFLTYDWSYLFSTRLTVNSTWSAFSDVLYSATDFYVPTSNTVIPKRRRVCPKNCAKALEHKQCLWWKHFVPTQAAEENCRYVLQEAELKCHRQVVGNSNLGIFYKHVNSRLSKGGLTSHESNYRLTALTSVVCKIMEHVTVQHLLNYLYRVWL